MNYSLIIQEEAISEIKAAFEWYEEQSKGLGYDFLKEIETCYQSLSEHPEHYSFINQLYRRIKTKRFPYILIYEFEVDTVIIVRVRHIKQKPINS